ncbi:MAG: beta-galactosidase [Bacteroidales bacterium]
MKAFDLTGLVIALLITSFLHQAYSQPSDKKALVAEMKSYNGRTTLFINGQPHDGIFCSTRAGNRQDFIDAGFDIFNIIDGGNPWVADSLYDFQETDEYNLDKLITDFLFGKPDAKIIVRLGYGYPRNFWWAVENKDEQAVPHWRNFGRKMPSYASLKWREEAGKALEVTVRHLEERFGNNIIGYLPGNGSCAENFEQYAYTEIADRYTNGYQMGDYSEPMQRAYRAYVKDKYKTIDAINSIYGLKLQSFSELKIPEVDQRLNAGIGILRSIRDEQAVLDYYEIFNRQVYETVVFFAKKVKEATNRNKLVFVFYGYNWVEQPSGGITQARSGHVNLEEVISCPDVDYIAAPYEYSFRQLEGVVSGQGVVGSVIRRGKQYLHEFDGSTYLKNCWPSDHHNPTTPAESGNLLRRDMTKALMEGTSLWFMDLAGGMFSSPAMISELKKTLTIGREIYFKAGFDNRQVAVVLQSRDGFYYREGEALRAPLIQQFKQFELERMGLGYDDLLLEDLKYLDPKSTEQYKVWIFPSSVHFDDSQLELIKKHCMRNGNHILWVYAPGALSEAGIDLRRMEQITGFKYGYTMEPGELAVKTIEGGQGYLAGRKSPIVYGTYGELSPDFINYYSSLRHYPGSDVGFSVSPRFYITEADHILGYLPDIKNQPAGFAVKNMGNWVSVYSAAPLVPKIILRNIARTAGCHVYTDFPGQTYQSQNYVGFFAHETGTCTIKLPYRSRVTDVYNNLVISEGTSTFSINLQVNDAVLFNYEPDKSK